MDLRQLSVFAIASIVLSVWLVGCIAFNYGLPRPLEAMKITGQKYAVLISGRTEKRHVEGVKLVYETLLKSEFLPKNIVILDAKGDQKRPYPVNAPADSMSIRLCFRYLANKIGPTDLLFVYVGDHGRLDERWVALDGGWNFSTGHIKKREIAEIGLIDGCLDEIDFATCVDKIHPHIGIFIFTQCYGGFFAKRLEGTNRITIAPTRCGKCNSYAFTRAFFAAFEKRTADLDGNGRISIREAFCYASKHGRSIITFWRPPFIMYGVSRDIYLN